MPMTMRLEDGNWVADDEADFIDNWDVIGMGDLVVETGIADYSLRKKGGIEMIRVRCPVRKPARDLGNNQIHNFVLADISEEREEQDRKWGADREIADVPAHTLDFFGNEFDATLTVGIPSERQAKRNCQSAFKQGNGTWAHIVVEELAEAVEAKTPADRRKELVQLAAVVVAWIENIDRRAK